MKQLLDLLIALGNSRLTAQQCASIIPFLRVLRLPVLAALLLFNAEIVRVAVAHFEGRGVQANLQATDESKPTDAPADPTGESPEKDVIEEDALEEDVATDGTGEKPEDEKPEDGAERESDLSTHEHHATEADESDADGPDADEPDADEPDAQDGAPEALDTHEEASEEDDRPRLITPEQLYVAIQERDRIASELGTSLVNLIRVLATAHDFTRQVFEIIAGDIWTVLDELAQLPIEKLYAPLPTIQEVNAPTEESDPHAVAESDSQPQPSVEQQADVSVLVLFNPLDSGGEMRFLVNGEFHVLLPGEVHRFDSKERWHVQFHRGDRFGDADLTLTGGHYEFRVTDNGWDLAEVADSTEESG